MRTWLKRTLIGVFGASLLFGGLAACSHHQPGQMTEADFTKLRERVIDKAGRELTLDEAQKAKLGRLADALRDQRSALVAGATAGSASDPRAQFSALIAGAQFDRSAAQTLIDAKTGAVRDKAPAVVNAMADFFDSLQPAQQQKLRDFVGRGGHRFGFGRG